MMRRYIKNRFQTKIILGCIAITVFVIMLLVLYQYSVTSGIVREKIRNETARKLETVSYAVDRRLQNILSFTDTFVSNAEINQQLNGDPDRYTYNEATLLSTVFKIAMLSNDNLIDSIIVYTEKDKRFIGGNGICMSLTEIKSRMQAMEESGRLRNWTVRYEDTPYTWGSIPEQKTLSLYYILQNTTSMHRTGFVYIAMNPSALLSYMDTDRESRRIFLLDEYRQVICGTGQNGLTETEWEQIRSQLQGEEGNFMCTTAQGQEMVVYTSSGILNWHLVELIPGSSLNKELSQIFIYLFLFLLAVLTVAVVLTILAARKTTEPLRRLQSSMIAVQNGNYEITVPVDSKDEIGQVAETYNMMLTRVKQLIDEIYATEKQKRDIELQALQMQINPHFLYNTLNSIHWMAIMHGMQNISNMVNALISLLRYSLQDPGTFVTLEKEMENLKQYLYIQNVRFNNGIVMNVHMDRKYGQVMLPRLLLQPIVENAIVHGLRSREGKGVIEIDVREEKNALLIDVSDNGIGFPTELPEFVPYEQLEQLLPSDTGDKRIGLKNAHERIRLNFGQPCGLLCRSIKDERTTIRILIPLSFEHHEEEGNR